MAFMVIITFLANCTAHKQYRTKIDNLCRRSILDSSKSCNDYAKEINSSNDGWSYMLGFIEFDDQGQLWDRDQMKSVVDWLSSESEKKDLLIVVFVHGWKHNTSPDDDNLKTFRKILRDLSYEEYLLEQANLRLSSKSVKRSVRQIVGLYLGWRGSSVPIPVIENLSFWDRKNTAQKIGHGGVTEVLSRIERITNREITDDKQKYDTRLVVIGHSFGGLVLHTALTQILTDRFVNSYSSVVSDTKVKGFGDLIVLINPAIEAIQFTPISDMTTGRANYNKFQLPILLILTSKNDNATGKAFPFGRFLSTMFSKTRDMKRSNAITGKEETISGSVANITSIGHFDPYITHELYPNHGESQNNIDNDSNYQSLLQVSNLDFEWFNDRPQGQIVLPGITLERYSSSAGRNPYLNVSVDKNLIKDHNDIYNDHIVNLIKYFSLITTKSNNQKFELFKFLLTPGMTSAPKTYPYHHLFLLENYGPLNRIQKKSQSILE